MGLGRTSVGAVGLGVGLVVALLPATATAQTDARLWGRVETVSGEAYEGFLRWDRNEASPGDVLDGSKEISRDAYLAWREHSGWNESERERSIELLGFRIVWNEDDEAFPRWADSGIRFGHVRSLEVVDDQRAEIELVSGERVELRGGGTDLGVDMRELVVEIPQRGRVEVEWEDLDRVTFLKAPAGAAPRSARLYGTVTDRWGNRYTGAVAWDTDEILGDDILDGEEDGRDREIPFSEIAGIERTWVGSRVTLVSGEEMELSGTNDVDDDNRGIQISDPGLGLVDVEWRAFESVRFHPAEVDPDGPAFDGGRRLRGTVVTRSGDAITGYIRWDADEEWSWEFLDGSYRDVTFAVEFGAIERIERASSRGGRVFLRDGRTLDLEDSNDVDEDNKGVFVLPDGSPEEAAPADWIRVSWDDFRSLDLHFEADPR